MADDKIIIDPVKLVDSYIEETSWRTKENSNVSYSIGGYNNFIGQTVTSAYWLDKIYPKDVSKAHKDAFLHIHDLGWLGPYCFESSAKFVCADGTIKSFAECEEQGITELDVLSYNEETEMIEVRHATEIGCKGRDSLYKVSLRHYERALGVNGSQQSEVIEDYLPLCTDYHEFLIKNKGWKECKSLKSEDALMEIDKEARLPYGENTIYVNDVKKYKSKENVYCMNVEKNHNFILLTENGHYVVTSNCAGWSLADLIKRGISGVRDKIFTKPAKHLSVLVNQIVNFICIMSNCWSRDTKILLANGHAVSFGDLETSDIKNAEIMSFDPIKNTLIATPAIDIGIRKQKSEMIKIELENGDKLICDPYQKIKLRDGDFVEAKDLEEDDVLENLDGGVSVLSVEDGRYEDSYCMDVPILHNFVVVTENGQKIISKNCWAGAQAFSSFDTYLAPFIKADNLSREKVRQDMQSFMFGMNFPSRVGSQPPFSNITVDLVVPNDLKDKHPIVGGVEQEFTFGDCQAEMNMLNEELFKLVMEGDANHGAFQYPIITCNIDSDFDYDSEPAVLLFKMAAKTGNPYFALYNNSDMKKEEARSMCPMVSDTEVVIKSKDGIQILPIGEVYNKYINEKYEFETWVGNGWCKCKPVSMPKTKVYHIEFSNGESVDFGENHLQPTKDYGTIKAKDLKVDMLVEFSPSPKQILKDNEEKQCMGFHIYGQNTFNAITGIQEIEYDGNLYCFEVDNDDHIFVLANGLYTHNCRLRLDLRQLIRSSSGGVGGAADKTGSIGVVTLNLPRMAYLNKGNKESLLQMIGHYMDLASQSLEIKRKYCDKFMDLGMYPYSKEYLGTFNNHFSTIGIVGLTEACSNFFGSKDKDLSTEEGLELGKEILNFMRNKLSDFQERTGHLYNLEATPAESTAYRFAKHDCEEFEDIIVAGIKPKNVYYTNSCWIPVDSEVNNNVWDTIDIQEQLQPLFTGGTVQHIFLGEEIKDWKRARDFVRKVAENTKLPYITLSPKFSVCAKHGLITQHPTNICPKCLEEQQAEYEKKLKEIDARLDELYGSCC